MGDHVATGHPTQAGLQYVPGLTCLSWMWRGVRIEDKFE